MICIFSQRLWKFCRDMTCIVDATRLSSWNGKLSFADATCQRTRSSCCRMKRDVNRYLPRYLGRCVLFSAMAVGLRPFQVFGTGALRGPIYTAAVGRGQRCDPWTFQQALRACESIIAYIHLSSVLMESSSICQRPYHHNAVKIRTRRGSSRVG